MMEAEHRHLSDQELERYRDRRMSSRELLASDDHLAECSDCGSRLWSGAGSTEALDSIEETLVAGSSIVSGHLTFDQMAALVDNAVTEPDRELFDTHLAYCSGCRDEVGDLLRDKSMIQGARDKAYAPSRRALPARAPERARGIAASSRVTSFRWALQAAAAAVIVLLVSWGMSVRLGRTISRLQSRIADLEHDNQDLQKQSRATSALEEDLAAALRRNEALKQQLAGDSQTAISLNDGAGRIALEKDGRLTGADFLNPSDQAAVKAVLTAGRVKVSADITSLRSGSGTLMGEAGGQRNYGLVDPVGKVVRSDRPAFRWRTTPGAVSYELTLYGDDFQEVAASGPVAQTNWIPKSTLSRGKVYTWQVVTVVDGKQVVLPPA